MPKISVIMSVYNASRYLHQAVDSVLRQSYTDFEFIIIEDCSTDNSLEILLQYQAKDSRIKLIRKDQNKGTKGFIENLNTGLADARGEYIARMDADDICMLDRFEKQINYLSKNPDTFIIGSSLKKIDENGKDIGEIPAKTSDNEIKESMLQNIALYHPVIMFRNDKKTKYREKAYYCEDYDMYLRLMLDGKKMGNLNANLLQYRILDSSISRKDDKFVRWLFVEKIRSFYLENKKNGSDSYDKFDPEDFKKILDQDFKNSIDDLLFGAKYAIKHKRKSEYQIILNKIKRFYPKHRILLLNVLNLLPAKFSKLYLLIGND